IVVIKEGVITELGKYEELMVARQSFYRLIKEYSAKHSLKRKNSQAVTAPGTSTGASGCDHVGGQVLSDTVVSEQPDDLETEDMSSGSEADSSVTIAEDNDIMLKKSEACMDEEEDELIAEEVLKKGHIEWRLIKAYVKACTIKISVAIVLSNLVAQMCMLGSSLWLKHWISKTKEELQGGVFLFLGILASFTLVYVISYILFVHFALAVARIKASESIHSRLISTVIRLPM
ncbi:Multidrug resistance-associated protein 1, partial [Mortierella sp. NVP85]